MIISCSRRTDIPAFYSDWFFNWIREGFVLVRNPMNARQVRKISLAFADVDCMVFWTKDPGPMLDKLHLLQDYNYYFQFTLTPYNEDIEPNLPLKTKIMDSFQKLSDKIGKQRVVWRYDPIMLSKNIGIEYHADHFAEMARCLSGYTEKCVISFVDRYRHTQVRMAELSARPPDEFEMQTLAKSIVRIAGSYQMKVETCAEKSDLADLGIAHGRCIDDRLIAELTGRELIIGKDKYQRTLCGCVSSTDIGQYNTCRHLCKYCYANVSSKKVGKNSSLHDFQSPLLIGEIGDR